MAANLSATDLVKRIPYPITPAQVKLGLMGLFALSGAPKALGLAGAAFEKDMKLPGFWALFTGLLEVACVALLYTGQYETEALYLLLAIMGGATFVHLIAPSKPVMLVTAAVSVFIYYLLETKKAADPIKGGGAFAAGIAATVFARTLYRPKKAGSKKSN